MKDVYFSVISYPETKLWYWECKM